MKIQKKKLGRGGGSGEGGRLGGVRVDVNLGGSGRLGQGGRGVGSGGGGQGGCE